MNQGYKLQNTNLEFNSSVILPNIPINSNNWGYSKSRPYSQISYNKRIENEILNNLPENVFREIFPFLEEVYLKTGECIYQPEDVINYLYFPETAIISDFQILEDGKTLEVAMIGKEGIVGINSVFNSHSSINWLQVSIFGKAWRIDAKTFHNQFVQNGVLQEVVFDYINSYIAQISQKVICNSHHSVEERLCCWLLMISDRCGQTNLPLTQEQIAGFLGVHRPSVTLITQSLREKGIINYLRGKISILDKAKLEFSACDCYSNTKII
ncbi:MAG: Crp/Fnr family transcriptional regulator [Pyrinomonadaceae bacterium]|nr:Crp/Fnr family transcriptional regulator [Pyrinomonadaceae bacterium]